jgi:hypothetical protein
MFEWLIPRRKKLHVDVLSRVVLAQMNAEVKFWLEFNCAVGTGYFDGGTYLQTPFIYDTKKAPDTPPE